MGLVQTKAHQRRKHGCWRGGGGDDLPGKEPASPNRATGVMLPMFKNRSKNRTPIRKTFRENCWLGLGRLKTKERKYQKKAVVGP